ncbi:MAG TPA: TonB-dependent receptor [Lysobacter sp.]
MTAMRPPIVARLLVLAFAMPTSAFAADGWDWAVAPYLWAPTIGADLREDRPPAENQQAFGDWIDKIEFAFLGHVEGQGDRFGVFGDVVYLALGDSRQYPRMHTDADLDAGIVELAAVLPLGRERFQGLDLFGGLRYFDVSTEARFDPVNDLLPVVVRKRDESFTDFLFGARYTVKFSDRWDLTLRGDGSTGDTDGSWSASANVQYHAGPGFWVFGYRYLDVDLPMRDSALDLKLYGPLVGYAFTF